MVWLMASLSRYPDITNEIPRKDKKCQVSNFEGDMMHVHPPLDASMVSTDK